MNSKKELRAQLLGERRGLSTKANLEASKRIVAGLETILGKLEFNTIHVYDAIVKNGEVDVSPVFDIPEATVLTSQKIDAKWQIVDSKSGVIIMSPNIDVFIVPMLGFDAKLHRLGYGGGYYDRLLAEYPKAVKIGVCFEQGRVALIPHEPHDVNMDIVVTEASVIVAM